MISRTFFVLALCTAGCAGDNHSTNHKPTPPVGSGSPQPPGSDDPDRSPPMSGSLAAANAAFRAHAAKQLGISVDEVQGGGTNEAIAQMDKNRVGGAWSFAMHPPGDHERAVRGWATGDGTVITLDQNLGVLLAEAGVWGGGAWPDLNRDRLADRLADTLAWSLGMNHTVYVAPHQGIAAPEITLNADGSGTFSFVVEYRPPGPGRAPIQLTRVDIKLTSDHHATAERTRVPPP